MCIRDSNGGEGNKIRGKIDLLVVYEDQEGNQSVEIYDLKLSTNPEDRPFQHSPRPGEYGPALHTSPSVHGAVLQSGCRQGPPVLP